MARDGIADVTYVSPGYQPGRFPIIDAGNLPFMISNAKEGTGAIDEWYRKHAAKEMGDVKFCFAFLHDPGTFHSKTKKIMVPGDVKGMKIRPAHATVATWVTQLGGTNVNASAPEVRDIIEKGVAEAVTFPWGSIPLFGIDKVTKYHMDAPLYVTSFVWVMNKAKYEQHVGGAEEGDRRPLHQPVGRARREPVGRFRACRHPEAQVRSGARGLLDLRAEQLAEWKKAPEPVVAVWAEGVKKAGGDPDAILKDLKATLAKRNSAY